MEFRLFAAHKQWKAAAAQPTRDKNADAAKKKRPADPGPVANDQNYRWTTQVPILVRAMVLADQTLFIAGPPDVLAETRKTTGQEPAVREQEAALAGRSGAILRAVSAENGETLADYKLDAPPVFDGMAAAHDSLFISTVNGKLLSFSTTARVK